MVRQKVTLRLNAEVIDLVRLVANALEVSPASLVDCLLLEGLQRYLDDGLDLADHLTFSDRGRYRFQALVDLDGLQSAIGQKVNIT